MAYALVGSKGAVAASGNNAAVTPAWGTSETRAAGNLLVLWCRGNGTISFPATPAGWSIGKQITIGAAGTGGTLNIFFKIAAGSDAAPTIAALGGSATSTVQLAEFSGNLGASPLDQSASATGTTSPQVATAAGADVQGGELVVYLGASRHTVPLVGTLASTLNNGAAAQETTDNGTSSASHYDFGYGITTGNAGGDSDSFAFTTTSINSAGVILASFQSSAAGATAPAAVLNLQAVPVTVVVAPPATVTLSAVEPVVNVGPAIVAAVLNLTGAPPGVSISETVSAPAAVLNLTSVGPILGTASTVSPPAPALTLTIQAPAVLAVDPGPADWTVGFVRDDTTGALILTTVTAGSSYQNGFVRSDATGKLVYTTVTAGSSYQAGFVRADSTHALVVQEQN